MVMLLKRKGDVTIATVILIVLGLAVLVMLIVGFTKGWDTIFKPLDNAPSELQTIAKACALYAQGGLTIDFCNYRKIEVNGKDELVNCIDDRIKKSLISEGINLPKSLTTCADESSNLKNLCEGIAESKRVEVKVNNLKNCKETLNPSLPSTGSSGALPLPAT